MGFEDHSTYKVVLDSMGVSSIVLDPDKIKDISDVLLDKNGKMKLLSYLEYKNFSWETFRYFCHEYSRYGIPTVELVELLKKEINGRDVIEIGAGSGDLGHHLRIRMTDNKQQEDPFIAAKYKSMGSPVIKYPDDVEKIDALEAVKKYMPKVVVASWVTAHSPVETTYGSNPTGVKESEILKLVDTYILVGNLNSHGDKPIMKIPHRVINEPFIISRGMNREGNRVWVWDKK